MTRLWKILQLAFAIALTASAAPAAQLRPSSDLLLPSFEVDLDPAGVTTLFAVGNAADKPVDVLATVRTNWGIPILDVAFTLQPEEIRTVNLRDWLRDGGDPGRSLSPVAPAHLAAAASGRPSPKDGLYYGTEVRPGLAVGSVTLRTRAGRSDALWGDWFVVDATGAASRGNVLVDIDRAGGHSALCRRFLLRYLGGGPLDASTRVVVWRDTVGQPSATPAARPGLQLVAGASSESGRRLDLLALDTFGIADLGLADGFGSLRIETAEDVYIGVEHSAGDRFSVALQAFCLAGSCDGTHTALGLDLRLDGQAVDTAPGPLVDNGTRFVWTVTVTNTGKLPVHDVAVEGVDAACPGDRLDAGESMECLAIGEALANDREVPVTVWGRSSCADVSASAVGHYQGVLVDVFP
jgi:hypothetical protein